MSEAIQFAICSDVKQPAGGIIGTSGKGITIREESSEQNSETKMTSTTYRRTERR